MGSMKESARARNTDPETAHEAAKKVDVQDRESDVLIALVMGGPMNCREIAARLGLDRDQVSPRMEPMAVKGLVEKTGERRDGQNVWRVIRKVL